MSNILHDKRILVTGGTGSMGKRFVERATSGDYGRPRSVTVFSRDEAKQYDMKRTHPHAEYIIGDIRNADDVRNAMRDRNIVVHAAALKQVPSCEYSPWQAIQTNCLGAQNIVQAAHDLEDPPECVISVSTDKACKPTTVMGMTKALQERIMIAANVGNECTRFLCVRYGNVIGSRGSVIPLFQEQIKAGGPVTVTDPQMTRYLMTLDHAVDLVLTAIGKGRRGDIWTTYAPAAKIADIAAIMTYGTGITTKIVGKRPGEKMHEVMISDEESPYVDRYEDANVIRPSLPELRYAGEVLTKPREELTSKQNVMDLCRLAQHLRLLGITR